MSRAPIIQTKSQRPREIKQQLEKQKLQSHPILDHLVQRHQHHPHPQQAGPPKCNTTHVIENLILCGSDPIKRFALLLPVLTQQHHETTYRIALGQIVFRRDPKRKWRSYNRNRYFPKLRKPDRRGGQRLALNVSCGA